MNSKNSCIYLHFLCLYAMGKDSYGMYIFVWCLFWNLFACSMFRNIMKKIFQLNLSTQFSNFSFKYGLIQVDWNMVNGNCWFCIQVAFHELVLLNVLKWNITFLSCQFSNISWTNKVWNIFGRCVTICVICNH